VKRPAAGRAVRTTLAGLLLGLALAPAPLRPAAAPLEIEVLGPRFAGGELVVEVRQSGALAGRKLAVQLAVDGASVGRFELAGEVTRLRARTERMAAGSHEVLVKSGTLRAVATLRVWPGWLPWAGGGFLAALGLAAYLLRRRGSAAASA